MTPGGNRMQFGKGSDGSSPTADREERLLGAVREYTAALEAGQRPDRRELLARHPDIADELSACLGGLAFLQSAAAQIPGASGPASSTTAGPSVAESPPTEPLGDFRLEREIGRGGMGVVYEAIQLSLGRRVAVKVLPLASSFDPRHLQRFRNEAQAAAQLHHTNIVPVYAVGCERSVHFYAMQLIEGKSLAELIRELRRLAGRTAPAADDPGGKLGETIPWQSDTISVAASDSPAATGSSSRRVAPIAGADKITRPAVDLSSLRSTKGSLYFRAVARLGLQAAEGLDYAHRAGVVHRDIKPANLLLDFSGNLWITDFGLAQFYTETGLTRTGDLLGTLRYMSPEQASGRAVVLDQRTDIYSLGVTLYELLTLERALPGETREQLLFQLGSHEPRPLRSIDKAIPPELETIVAKAIAKEPAERFASARDMAEDLRRFLQDEPIRARPPSAWDKAVKWTRRHKSLALGSLLMLVLSACGLLISTLLIAREQAKTRAAYVSERDRAAEASEQRARAEASFGQARDAVNYLSRVAADELAGTGSADVRKEMLEAALDYYQGFLEVHQTDASVGAGLAEARSYVSKILAELSAVADLDRARTRVRLLQEPSVRAALKLSAQQIIKAQQIEGARSASSPGEGEPGRPEDDEGFSALSSEQKRQRFANSAAQLEATLNGVLTPQQAQRLRQIARQVEAPASFSDPDVAEALGLARDKKEAIRRIQAAFRTAVRKSLGPPPSEDRPRPPREIAEERDRAIQMRRAEAVRQILSQLTPSQIDVWSKLIGEPFSGPPYLYPGHFEPGRPGRDGPEPDGLSPDRRGPRGRGDLGPEWEERGRDGGRQPPPIRPDGPPRPGGDGPEGFDH